MVLDAHTLHVVCWFLLLWQSEIVCSLLNLLELPWRDSESVVFGPVTYRVKLWFVNRLDLLRAKSVSWFVCVFRVASHQVAEEVRKHVFELECVLPEVYGPAFVVDCAGAV